MKRKPLAELISVLVKGIAPTTAVATSLISPLAQAASGDLDPAFAGQGRLGPIPGLEGAAWSVEALDDGGALVGGGDLDFDFGWYCYYYAYDCQIEASNFTSRLNQDGSIDAAFQAAGVADVEVFGIARQADGKIVAAGRKVTGDFRHRSNRLLVFRLATDGSLDTAFANDGLFELSSSDFGPGSQAHALELEPNGRIVVAGVREIVVDDALVSELIALRLRADGRLDQSFGAAGVFVGPAVPFDNNIRLARTAAGAYRVANTMDAGCAVVGVTAGGALDAAFGDSGIAQVESAPGEGVFCQSLAVQDDGRLLLGGQRGRSWIRGALAVERDERSVFRAGCRRRRVHGRCDFGRDDGRWPDPDCRIGVARRIGYAAPGNRPAGFAVRERRPHLDRPALRKRQRADRARHGRSRGRQCNCCGRGLEQRLALRRPSPRRRRR